MVWPRERSFAAQAEASVLWALRELRRLVDAGDLTAARAAASSVESFWVNSVSAQPRAFEQTLEVALVLDAPEAATMLLGPFHVEMLAPDHAKATLGLAVHYGPQWTAGLLGVWFDERSRTHRDAELGRPDGVAALPAWMRFSAGAGSSGNLKGLSARSNG